MILLSANNIAKIDFIQKLDTRFDITIIGQVSLLLGANITHNNGIIVLNQKRYIVDMLKHCDISESHPAPTAMVTGGDTDEYSPLFADITLYKSLVGSLLYTATYTWPDIAFAIAKIGQTFIAPTEHNWKAAKRILRYLKGKMDYSLIYKYQNKPQLIGYSNADWAGDKCNRKSISDFVFTYGNSIII